MEENKTNGREEIFSEKVKAGKRTYFFDVKATRSNDYYLTITESKKRFKDDGFTYEKHKIFLYKEDFNKFVEALTNTVNHVKQAALIGADVITAPPATLRALVSHPLTDKGLAAFIADWAKTGQKIA